MEREKEKRRDGGREGGMEATKVPHYNVSASH
jgi:hypothetical protein